MVFGKKKEESPKSEVPVQAVISMRDRGLSNEQVIEQLKSQGFSLQSIRDALTQADVKKSAVTPSPLPELPPMPGGPEMPEPEVNNDIPALTTTETTAPEAPLTPVRGGMGLNAPSFAPAREPKTGMKVEEMERILEEIVDERWKDVTAKFNELESSRVKGDTKLEELSKRVSELSGRIDEITSVVMGKVDEYKKTMDDVDIEIKALEKVMQKLVPSMAEQVKELKDVVVGLKGSKPLE